MNDHDTRRRWLSVFLLLEFQSTVDRLTALRLMVCVGLLYQQLKVLPGEALSLVLPIVLYNGRALLDVAEMITGGPTSWLCFSRACGTSFWKSESKSGERNFMEKGLEQGTEKGEAEVLLRQLERKFGEVCPEYRQRVADTDLGQLVALAERILTAESIDDVFADKHHLKRGATTCSSPLLTASSRLRCRYASPYDRRLLGSR